MIRANTASLYLLGLIATDALLIGAAGMWPRIPSRSDIVVAPLEPPLPLPPEEKPVRDVAFKKQTGLASWYGDHWRGRTTASGKAFDDSELTAAHRTLPLNSRVRVTNLRTGRSVEVTITDRGPYTHGRVIDLSQAAAKKLGMVKRGLVPVRIETVPG